FRDFVNLRPVRYGMSQKVSPMNVLATGVPTEMWKCPTIQSVFWTTSFSWKLALMLPPAPPGMKNAMVIKMEVKRTSFHGNFLNQPNRPVAPFLRPEISKFANIVKAVMSDGIMTMNVSTTCRNFQKFEMPGSVNWWWKPTGIENRMNNT